MTQNSPRGYTLVELMVSISIFAIIMLAATAAYFSFISYNRQAQTSAAIVNSLFFTIDTIGRELRTGINYSCFGGCTASGVDSISFIDANDCLLTYDLSGTTITRSLAVQGTCSKSAYSDTLTDPSIVVESLLFFVRGETASDIIQPMVTIVIGGYACVPNTDCATIGITKIPFNIETGATQRLPDL